MCLRCLSKNYRPRWFFKMWKRTFVTSHAYSNARTHPDCTGQGVSEAPLNAKAWPDCRIRCHFIIEFDVHLETNPVVRMDKAFRTAPEILQRKTGEHPQHIVGKKTTTPKLHSRSLLELFWLMERKQQENLTTDFIFIFDHQLEKLPTQISHSPIRKPLISSFVIMVSLLLLFPFGHEIIACSCNKPQISLVANLGAHSACDASSIRADNQPIIHDVHRGTETRTF